MTNMENKVKRRYFGKLIDIHAHILPNIDDGSRTFEESLELVKMAIEAGFGAIVATPHYSRKRGADGLDELVDKLKKKVQNQYPDFEIYLGHETYYHEELPDKLKTGTALTIERSNYVLMEFENGVSFQTISRAIRKMNNAGYTPVLAHVERYSCLKEAKKLDEICGRGCFFQMNYESVSGSVFRPEVRRCRKLVKDGKIHVLGTDMHRKDYRKPDVDGALRWLSENLKSNLFDAITYKNAEKILKNEDIGWNVNE